MASKKSPKIATIYDVPEEVALKQSKVDKLWKEFDLWWRKKYGYHTIDAIGAVKLWYEFLEERRLSL